MLHTCSRLSQKAGNGSCNVQFKFSSSLGGSIMYLFNCSEPSLLDTCVMICSWICIQFCMENNSLVRYCSRLLPFTCTVIVLEHCQNYSPRKKGGLRADPTSTKMIKKLRRSFRSFGRTKKTSLDECGGDLDDRPRPSDVALSFVCKAIRRDEQDYEQIYHSAELETCYLSDTSLSQEFGRNPRKLMDFPAKTECSSEFTFQDQNDTHPSTPSNPESGHTSDFSFSFSDLETPRILEAAVDSEVVTPGWPLMYNSIGFGEENSLMAPPVRPCPGKLPSGLDSSKCIPPEEESPPSPRQSLPSEKSTPILLQKCVSGKVKPPRSPLHRILSDKTRSVFNRIDRRASSVDWTLHLPNRNKELSKSPTLVMTEEIYAKILQEIARDAFVCVPISLNAKEFSVPDIIGRNTSLAQRMKVLCLDRKCSSFSREEIEAGTCNFSASNMVGRGGGSEVYKWKMPDGKVAAVKRLNRGPKSEEELLNDVDINTSLSAHPHIVRLLGYCVDSSHLILVYEYLSEGSVESRLHARTNAPTLPWLVRFKVAVGIAKALDCLHNGTSRPVIHRDVKTANILLTADFEPQLSDFGLAKWAPKKASHILCDDVLGTFGYLAPEYFMYGRVNNKTDVYALGVVLLELITGRMPIDNTSPKGQENLVNWVRPLLHENNHDKIVDPRLEGVYDVEQMNRMILAASLCVQLSPQRRPQMSQVLQILCSSYGRLQNMHLRPDEREDSLLMELEEELEEGDFNIVESSTFDECTTDIQTHLALAMLGVEDELVLHSGVNQSGVALPHSSDYLDGRFIPSSRLIT
ncbi:uncharacterized protein [Physcomitrium patens]|uniref:Protein kinase domain-containing protein n=2 Tax=Physcomitrium patens TaxID=3218 RepID=A0A7I4ATE4_PHYPA|nr:serine/threonine-protein kinase-like protein ACR4 isoform X1 [Physcomitrium patens]XP_024394069.1 serine/threonine-protein kinase-like protein ACR4 isoform X1 [Physcomitrium patens]XP_024394070.1 serine/threonine-protein kinase-like protein ACR4 isoform X1 [Physcomitrium patens]|eukprot:XP_024394068.1 serine/threonine-protein kinase-like protein ACR4 isoform X1 [Physcomitrella patens]